MVDVTEREKDGSDKRAEWQRRRRLAKVFGEVLPETTSDERAAGAGRTGESDQWYRENRPPHHDAS
jgi:hypothetical protein